MKKKIIAVIVFSLLCINLFAKESDKTVVVRTVSDYKHNEAYFGMGTSSTIGLFTGIAAAIGTGIAESLSSQNTENSENTEKKANDGSVFSMVAGYNYFFNEYFAAGGFATYEKFNTLDFYTVQAKATVQYGWEHFKFYQAASAGIMYVEDSNKPNFIFDITYLGMKLDFDSFNIFVDASVPSTGIVKIGAALKY